MRHSNITATSTISNQLVLYIDISLLTISKTTSKKIYGKASLAKPLRKPLTGDKPFGIEPAIRFYDIEDGHKTEKGEEA